MEDSPHFNAGYGAALTEAGEHELDASIMDGATLARRRGLRGAPHPQSGPRRARRAWSEPTACCWPARRPMTLRRATGSRWSSNRVLHDAAPRRRARAPARPERAAGHDPDGVSEAEKHGTVGAVALDRHGNLAAATSTGGFNNKPRGRVGDSPIIGAGTYAKNGVCAVSCTGQGEIFIRRAAAYDVAARMQLRRAVAARRRERGRLRDDDSHKHRRRAWWRCDATGNVLTPFNTLGMYRGWITTDGELTVATHQEVHRLGEPDRDEREPILIWGAGAIGGTIGAYWARAGRAGAAGRHRRRARARPAAPAGLQICGPVEEFTVKVVPASSRTRSAASTDASCWP